LSVDKVNHYTLDRDISNLLNMSALFYFSFHITVSHITAISLMFFVSLSLTAFHWFEIASAFLQITSPSKGEVVSAGSELQVSGISDDNANINCKVLVVVNNKRPYQETIPTGVSGPGDFSKWLFTISSQYADIKEGVNKITAKASCDSQYEPVLVLDNFTNQYVKYYSINVTGVSSGLRGLGGPGLPSDTQLFGN
jgi:hypothetical protein